MIHLAHYAVADRCPSPRSAISLGVPDWLELDFHLRELAPTPAQFRAYKAGTLDPETFSRQYWHRIGAVWRRQQERFEGALIGGTGFCWEKPGDFCHRRVLACWLHRQGYEVMLDGELVTDKTRIGG